MEIFAVAFLIFLNGLFAMSEMALVSSRKARLQKLVDEGDSAAAAALSLNSEPTRFLSTIQIGITSVGVLSGIVGEATLARPLASGFRDLGMADDASQWLATGLVSDAGVIEAQEHQMVRNVFRLDDRQITSLMVPRSEIVALDAELPTEENLAVIAASDHSRFPVLRGDSREIVGIVSAKHLLNQLLRNEPADIQRAMQAAVFVPETLTGMELLENFRASSTAMVVVMDEYGQPQGIV
ncbi:MAG: DUF21 domain-containing protein, partial [Betaproteobacteria bacterium]|nr:DUF21 domain-containing protein [Betaproteobacteria bacterium]